MFQQSEWWRFHIWNGYNLNESDGFLMKIDGFFGLLLCQSGQLNRSFRWLFRGLAANVPECPHKKWKLLTNHESWMWMKCLERFTFTLVRLLGISKSSFPWVRIRTLIWEAIIRFGQIIYYPIMIYDWCTVSGKWYIIQSWYMIVYDWCTVGSTKIKQAACESSMHCFGTPASSRRHSCSDRTAEASQTPLLPGPCWWKPRRKVLVHGGSGFLVTPSENAWKWSKGMCMCVLQVHPDCNTSSLHSLCTIFLMLLVTLVTSW